MAFTTETKALMTLGYGLTAINNRVIVFPPNVGADGLLFVEGILAELSALDTELKANISDSMAVKVQDLGLDYSQYIMQANARGSRLLEQLSAAIDVPVAFNRYKNSSKNVGSGIAVRNYY